MRERIVNGRWNMWVPDNVADWDGPNGDYVLGTGHEVARFESFRKHLRWGDTFLDVGTEHGWIAALIGREFVGAENMILCEPTPEFWVNIRKTWMENALETPLLCWAGFVADKSHGFNPDEWDGWWPESAKLDDPEAPGMGYPSLLDGLRIPTVTIDMLRRWGMINFNAINIDVEGAELLVLRGAAQTLIEDEHLRNIWVSVHPEMMKAYDHSPKMLDDFMHEHGWKGEHLATDHESHFHYTRS